MVDEMEENEDGREQPRTYIHNRVEREWGEKGP
jgi:hypothetical protein